MMLPKNTEASSVRVAMLAIAGTVGLMTSGCESPTLSSVPKVQAGPTPTPTRQPQSTPASDFQPETTSEKSASPGTRQFNLSDGTGTVGTITIAADGTATLKIQEANNAAVEYRGNFPNSVALKPKPEPLPEDDNTYQLVASGLVVNGCMSEDTTCESMLSQVTHQTEKLAPDDQSLAYTDDRFIFQDFSPAFLQQILEINRECGLSLVAPPCSTRIYTFRDGTLTTKPNGSASTEYTMTFHQPVSESVASSYVTMLNERKASEVQDAAIAVQSCPGEHSTALCQAELVRNSDGAVSGVKLMHLRTD